MWGVIRPDERKAFVNTGRLLARLVLNGVAHSPVAVACVIVIIDCVIVIIDNNGLLVRC